MSWPSARVLIWCDLGPRIGIGHAMRCVALAEELLERGFQPLFLADVNSVPFLRRELERRALPFLEPQTGLKRQLALIEAVRPLAVVIDSYTLPHEAYAHLHDRFPLLAIVDGNPRDRMAHLYLDQNIGAENDHWNLPSNDSLRIAGLRFALMRNEILRHRSIPQRSTPPPGNTPEVLAFFGGTDPHEAATTLTATLIATEQPFMLTVVGAREAQREQLAQLRPGRRQHIGVIAPTGDVIERASKADLVVSAAGTSSWELMCLGCAVAFVCVAENQFEGYSRIREADYGFSVGQLERIRDDSNDAVEVLALALSDSERRATLQRRVRAAVDGQGRSRVVTALSELRT